MSAHDNPRELLVRALEQALFRLNSIPHRYADTDFKLIENALAAARQVKPTERLLILLNGGLVQAVCTTQSDIAVAVLDQDIESADASEISAVEGEIDTLYGSLSRPAVTDAPELIASAWRTLRESTSRVSQHIKHEGANSVPHKTLEVGSAGERTACEIQSQ